MAERTAVHPPALSLPWWLQPVATVVILSGFVLYTIWAALQWHGYSAPYLSPFYSPPVTVAGIPISPAWWVLWIPGGFRATCYYYRKAYYRSYFQDPIACSHPEARARYAGETALPFILNNLHRFFLYGAIIVLAFLWRDTAAAFVFDGRIGAHLGSLLFLVNVVLLSGYTFGCHAFRHIVGGNLDCFSCARGGHLRHRLWQWVTPVNHRHGLWAWASLFSVSIADIYVRLLMAGVIADPRLF